MKTKKQLRAEAIERLEAQYDDGNTSAHLLETLLGGDVSNGANWNNEIRTLVKLLADDDANDNLAPESVISDPDGGSNVAYIASDSREKLEADVAMFCNGYFMGERQRAEVRNLLDRQAAITRREDNKGCQMAASDPGGHSNDGDATKDSRELLEADIVNESLSWLHTPYGLRKVRGWLDRQAAIAKHDGFLSGRASLDDEFNEMQNVVDKLYADLETAHAKNRSLKAHIGKMQDGRHAWHERAEKLQEQVDRLTAERDNLAHDLAECEAEREKYRSGLGEAKRLAHGIAAL